MDARKGICPECGAPCVVTGIGYSHEETPLQLAAPELLAALENCKVTLEAFLPDAFATISIVNSAIKKAKGE